MACLIKKEWDDTNKKRDTYSGLCNVPKARAKGVKSEIAIKSGRQDVKLVIFKRACAYGECSECGIEKYFTSTKSSLEWDAELEIDIKVYRDIARNNSDEKQKELVAMTATADKLLKKIADTAGSVMKHLWQSRWGSHMRRCDNNTFTHDMVRYKVDFSSTLDIHPQDQLNCAIAAHAIKNVMIFSLCL